MALERSSSGGNRFRLWGRRPFNGQERPCVRPRGVPGLARRAAGRIFLGRGGHIFPAFTPLGTSPSSIGALAAGRLFTVAVGRDADPGISRIFPRLRFPRSWLALGYLIVFGSVVAFTAYNWLLEHYSPTLVATHTYINPIVAVLLGWLLAGEAVTLNVLLSTALVIGAVMLVDRGTARLPQRL